MGVPRILLGVTGGIAAYKAAELVRALVKEGAEVQCVLTGRAEEFVTPTTLATLSERPVLRTEFEPKGRSDILHIDAVRWADALCQGPTPQGLAELIKWTHGARAVDRFDKAQDELKKRVIEAAKIEFVKDMAEKDEKEKER